jgi:predicted Zn-dependent protease
MNKIHTLLLAAAVALPFGLSGCNLGGVDLSKGLSAGQHLWNAGNLTVEDEDAIGQSAGIALTNTYQLCQDRALTKYVNFIGLTVASSSDDPSAKYVFAVLETPEVNAWSSPGGYVFVSRGVLNKCQDEAELAGVLAHEIAHICHHDGLDEIKAAEAKSAISEGASAYQKTAAFSSLADKGVDIFTKQSHSQPSELKADATAVHYLSAAGYDPASYLHFLQRLGNSGGKVMSTHPGTGQRISTVTQEMAKVRPGGATLAARYVTNAAPRP